MKIKGLFRIILALSLVFAIVGCSNTQKPTDTKADAQKSEVKTDTKVVDIKKIKLGIVGSDTRVWDDVIARLKPQGIEIEIIKFNDYNLPNDALANGDIDLNSFQHRIFLANYNESRGTDLVPIANTINAPLGIYSEKIKNISELKDGDSIAIPNDSTNGGRALILLQSAGVLKIDPEAKLKPTPKDIIENKLNIKIKELDATQTARAISDVTASIINGGMAVDAGLNPTKDAIYLEKVDEKSEPYINIIVARKKDSENEVYKKIVAEYQTEATKKLIDELFKGAYIAAW